MAIAASRAYSEAFATVDDQGVFTLLDLGFSEDELKDADFVHLTAIDGELYYTYGGQTPTTTMGHIIATGGEKVFQGRANAKVVQLIAKTGTVNVIVTLSRG